MRPGALDSRGVAHTYNPRLIEFYQEANPDQNFVTSFSMNNPEGDSTSHDKEKLRTHTTPFSTTSFSLERVILGS